MMQKEVKVVCRRCGRTALSDEFVLDPVYKLVVCKLCVNERKARHPSVPIPSRQPHVQAESVQEVKAKPAGWDSDDEYLEKAARHKTKPLPVFKKVDSEKVRYSCQKCKYNFIYNTTAKYPTSCPYCGYPVDISGAVF